MNIILLVFIILSSLFVASSVNNISCVTTAVDNFLEFSDAPDYFAAVRGKDSAFMKRRAVFLLLFQTADAHFPTQICLTFSIASGEVQTLKTKRERTRTLYLPTASAQNER